MNNEVNYLKSTYNIYILLLNINVSQFKKYYLSLIYFLKLHIKILVFKLYLLYICKCIILLNIF